MAAPSRSDERSGSLRQEAVSNIKERQLDLILTSPGGNAEAAEAIMDYPDYLRTRFDHIRAIVPLAAMLAATMMALATDEIVIGTHSQLGPIDPQFTIHTPEGPRSAPAQAILDQFEIAKEECKDPQKVTVWLPFLRSLLPGLIAQCDHQRNLAEDFAANNLEKYAFRNLPDAKEKARKAAEWFADLKTFKSHGRRVTRDDARAQGLNIVDLESDQPFQDLVLSVHHAVRLTFAGTGTTKLIENHCGRAYIEMVQQIAVQVPVPGPPGVVPPAPQGPGRTEQPQFPQPSPKAKPPRNAPCPCGSGKKYKNCHGV